MGVLGKKRSSGSLVLTFLQALKLFLNLALIFPGVRGSSTWRSRYSIHVCIYIKSARFRQRILASKAHNTM